MRLLGGLGLPYPRAGLLLTELFALGSLVLVWWLLEARATLANLACLALAALFPGSIYEHALFPVSLAVAGRRPTRQLQGYEPGASAGPEAWIGESPGLGGFAAARAELIAWMALVSSRIWVERRSRSSFCCTQRASSRRTA